MIATPGVTPIPKPQHGSAFSKPSVVKVRDESLPTKDKTQVEGSSINGHQPLITVDLGEIPSSDSQFKTPVLDMTEPEQTLNILPQSVLPNVPANVEAITQKQEHSQSELGSSNSLPILPQSIEVAQIKLTEREGSVELFVEDKATQGVTENKNNVSKQLPGKDPMPKPGGQMGKKFMKHPNVKPGQSKVSNQAPNVPNKVSNQAPIVPNKLSNQAPNVPMRRGSVSHSQVPPISSDPSQISNVDSLVAIAEEDVSSSGNLGESNNTIKKDDDEQHGPTEIIFANLNETCSEVTEMKSVVNSTEADVYLMQSDFSFDDAVSNDDIRESVIPLNDLNVSSDSEYSISSPESYD